MIFWLQNLTFLLKISLTVGVHNNLVPPCSFIGFHVHASLSETPELQKSYEYKSQSVTTVKLHSRVCCFCLGQDP